MVMTCINGFVMMSMMHVMGVNACPKFFSMHWHGLGKKKMAAQQSP